MLSRLRLRPCVQSFPSRRCSWTRPLALGSRRTPRGSRELHARGTGVRQIRHAVPGYSEQVRRCILGGCIPGYMLIRASRQRCQTLAMWRQASGRVRLRCRSRARCQRVIAEGQYSICDAMRISPQAAGSTERRRRCRLWAGIGGRLRVLAVARSQAVPTHQGATANMTEGVAKPLAGAFASAAFFIRSTRYNPDPRATA